MAEATPQYLIDVRELSRYYGGIRAVDNISFNVKKGEVLGFLGPNGAGKSTTMQMLCGALAPTLGSISINGIDLLEQPMQAKKMIGYLPEKLPLYYELTVNEYLRYCLQLHRIETKSATVAMKIAKQRCGLSKVGSRLIGSLSKGYQQRVGIAQAVIHSPHVVILDEPTVGLDPIQIREIRRLIRELGQDHGVILSTHILPEVQMTCSRVQIINHGRLVFNAGVDSLNQNLNATSLMLAFKTAPPVAAIERMPGVSRVESVAASRVRIYFESGQSPADEIIKNSVTNDWGLTELTPESQSLEQIFLRLTSSEEAVSEIAEEQTA